MEYTKDILFEGVSAEWREFLDNDLLDEALEELGEEGNDIVPPAALVFEFARLTPFSKIKIVICGQDPYPKAGYAHGLAFSCLVGVPGSLRNIYKCLKKTKWIETIPKSGDLTYWAEQGVLLVNGALTTRVGLANAHKDIWKDYTDKLFAGLSSHVSKFSVDVAVKGSDDTKTKVINHHPIFMLWGNYAKKKATLLDAKCTILTWNHPSPLAQSRYPFIDCSHFNDANRKLRNVGPIDWNQSIPESYVETRFEMNENRVVAFTDGSCNPNKICPEAIAGYAATFVLGKFKDVAIYGNLQNRPNFASNQRAEGMAIHRVLMYLKDHIHEWEECIIVTDSDFWIKMINDYMPGWDAKQMDFMERKNPDITIPLWDLHNCLTYEFGKTVEFRHVRSHDKDGWSKYEPDTYEYFCYFNNDYVDELAGYARKALKPGEHIIDEVEYNE